jgi:DNA polymerase-3 subunit delta
VKISGRQAASFARNPDAAARAVLVYGPDAGLVSERIQALVASVLDDPADPFRRVDLAADTLLTDPARLADEAAAISFTGGRRVVVVRGAGDRQAAVFESLLEGWPGDALVVVEGSDLGPRSALRRAFEGGDAAAALPCYADDAGSLSDLVRETLRGEGVGAEPAAVEYLVGQLGADRLMSRREIEKLALYVGAGGKASVEDARAVVGDAGSISLDEVADAVAGGEREILDGRLERSFRLGNSPSSVLLAVNRHLHKLRIVVAQVEAGQSIEQAVRSLRPPIFFKRKAAVERQAGLWRRNNLGRALNIVTEAELECRTTGQPERALCVRALFRVATAARSR